MSDFEILEQGETARELYGIEDKKITELELEALLEGKRLWTDIYWEYAITIRLKDRLKELDIDRENKRLHSIIKEVREYIEEKIIAWCNSKPELVMLDYDKITEILDKGSDEISK